jgi:methyltransferase-like protein 6
LIENFVDRNTQCRILNDEEKLKLQTNAKFIENYKKEKIIKEIKKSWDSFYKRNTTNFFKDRHWTLREFNELDECFSTDSLKIFEIGCGVGNFLYPLLKINEKIQIYACDFSGKAIELVKSNENFSTYKDRCIPFVCDITDMAQLESNLNNTKIDIATLIFVLSAIQPTKMSEAIRNIFNVRILWSFDDHSLSLI